MGSPVPSTTTVGTCTTNYDTMRLYTVPGNLLPDHRHRIVIDLRYSYTNRQFRVHMILNGVFRPVPCTCIHCTLYLVHPVPWYHNYILINGTSIKIQYGTRYRYLKDALMVPGTVTVPVPFNTRTSGVQCYNIGGLTPYLVPVPWYHNCIYTVPIIN